MNGPSIYVPVQDRVEVDIRSFIRSGSAKVQEKAIIAQDSNRASGNKGNLLTFTLMAKFVATDKWVAFESVVGTDGSALPQGIYLGPDILEAAIDAADILDQPILRLDALFDNTQLVIEPVSGPLLLTTVLDTGTVNARTVGDQLRMFGLTPISTIQTSGPEN